MSSFTNSLSVDYLRLMTNEVIKPEPQYNTLSKYMAKQCHEKNDDKEALVYITNSHGIQLRNDIKYYADKRELSGNDEANKMAPVLDVSNMTVFKNYEEILDKVKKLPEEWTVIQITKRYTPLQVLKESKDYWDCGIYITRFNCGKFAERIPPFYVTTKTGIQNEENLMESLMDIYKIRMDYFTAGGTSRKLKEQYSKTDQDLMKIVNEIQNHWLEEWRCLLIGRMQDKRLEKETCDRIRKAVTSYQKRAGIKLRLNEQSLDMLYLVTLSAHSMKNKEILSVLNYALHKNGVDKINSLMPLMEDLKRINLENSCRVKNAKKNPVIIIIDSAYELIPWEMLSPLFGQPVCRILSLHLLYALFKYHESSIVGGYRRVKIDSGFCLINPNKDLNECEQEMTRFLESEMPWIETEIGKVPDPKLLVSRFQKYNIFFYCGHGSGMQYLRSSDLKKTVMKGLVLLFGCSSNLPKSSGGRTPYENDTYTYMTNGCPCLIGCIYSITSSDADTACKKMLSSFLPSVKKEGSNVLLTMPSESDVLRGVVTGKMSCSKYWSQCAFVARGIPCKTVEGNFNGFLKSSSR